MVVGVRKLSSGACAARPVYQHTHFCVRAFHFLLAHLSFSLIVLVIVYFEFMDMILYFKIRSRGPFDMLINNRSVHIFDPLPIKKIMVGHSVHYIRSPLAEHMESTFHFTHYFPWISANTISFFHCFLSVVSIKFLSNESLLYRQIGVGIFQLRNFLDCLDGVIFRAHIQNQRYKSYYGDFGYYIDAISDIFGGTCLVIGCLLYFYKQRPVRSSANSSLLAFLMPFYRASPMINTRTHTCSSEEKDLIILNLEDEEQQSSSTASEVNGNKNLLESKETIFFSLGLFALRYSLAAMFWDRSVHDYEDILDSPADTSQQQALQLNILHSPLTILLFYLWRYLSALSIQDYLLFAIFIDRTWEFIQKTSTIAWWSLFITIFLTKMHIDQIRSVFSAMIVS